MEVSKVNSPNFGMAVRIAPSTEKYLKKTLSEDELRLIKRLIVKNKDLEENVLFKFDSEEVNGKNRNFQAIVGDKVYLKNPKTSTFGFLENLINNIRLGKI
jgi:hypothetical protein